MQITKFILQVLQPRLKYCVTIRVVSLLCVMNDLYQGSVGLWMRQMDAVGSVVRHQRDHSYSRATSRRH